MEKILFIIPYYGKWPDCFREWAYTAGYLKDQNIDFLLVTDLEIPFPLPENIHVQALTFPQLKEKIQSQFPFPVSLQTPYKLCDFRPAYGIIFREEIKEYAFWGHCDLDQIWGNVRGFITDGILKNNDKIQYMGHFVLYRNCPRMNQLFAEKGGVFSYQQVFSSPKYFSFDEHPGIMQLVVEQGISNYISHNQADISPKHRSLVISRVKNYPNQMLYWQQGHIYRSYIAETGQVEKDEFMYAHFQKKKPASLGDWEHNPAPEAFAYSAEGFSYIDPAQIDKAYLQMNAPAQTGYVRKAESICYALGKLWHFAFRCNMEEKMIWLKQRRATRALKQHKEYFTE